MHVIIKNQIGRIHHATGHHDLAKTRPTYAFIPEIFFDQDGFNRRSYLASRWPSINCKANPLAVGSHVIPDGKNPVSIRSRCPILTEFLTRLENIAAVKATPSAA